MRIGEFARKYNIAQSTIRHYLDMKLLIAEKEGSHFRFNEAAGKDLEKIIQLRELDFSLPEIQKILVYQRLSGGTSDEYRGMYLTLLEGKKEQMVLAQQQFERKGTYLKEMISELKKNQAQHNGFLGFPVSAIEILQCPVCKEALSIENGVIHKNMIMTGQIRCRCAYEAEIQDGIYLDKSAIRTRLLNGEPMPSGEVYLNAASTEFINFRYKGMKMVAEAIQRHCHEPKYIMELNYCVGFFLKQYLQYLPGKSTYILIDYDQERMIDLKRSLETYCQHKNFLFLCCDVEHIPFENTSVDVIIDYWMTKDYQQSNDRFLLDEVLPLLKQDGILAGVYPYFNPKSKETDHLPPQAEVYFNKTRLLEKLGDVGLEKMEAMDIGPIREDNPYNSDIRNQWISQLIYIACSTKMNRG